MRPLKGLWVGRLMDLPFFMMSFQLAVLPLNSFSNLSPAVLTALTSYSQYYWLLILLSSNSEVSGSSRHFFWGQVVESHLELSFNLICGVVVFCDIVEDPLGVS